MFNCLTIRSDCDAATSKALHKGWLFTEYRIIEANDETRTVQANPDDGGGYVAAGQMHDGPTAAPERMESDFSIAHSDSDVSDVQKLSFAGSASTNVNQTGESQERFYLQNPSARQRRQGPANVTPSSCS